MASIRPGPFVSAVLALALAVVAGSRPAASQVPEHEVRAAFVYNFTKFINWPAGSIGEDAFRVCVIGDDRLEESLRQMVSGEVAHGRPIALLPLRDALDVRRCQILYVGPADVARGRRALAAAKGLPILTVGDGARFLTDGGAVRFLIEDERVRFDVNLRAVEQAGLTMASAVLRVARRVEKSE
jgi:hypothetical protein